MNVKKVSTSSDAVLSGTYRITRVRLIAGTDAATAILFDALTQTGTEIVKLSANAANAVDKENWAAFEGIVTSNGVSVTLTGAGPILYLYYS